MKMYTTRKHSFPRYTLSVRLFPASKTEILSNHRKKQTVEIRSQHASDTFVIRSFFVVLVLITHTTHTQEYLTTVLEH